MIPRIHLIAAAMADLDYLHRFYDGPIPDDERRLALGYDAAAARAEECRRARAMAANYAANAAAQWREAKELVRAARTMQGANRRHTRRQARIALAYVVRCREAARYWRGVAELFSREGGK